MPRIKSGVLFSDSEFLPVAKKLSNGLKLPLKQLNIKRFKNGEIDVNVNNEIKNKTVILIKSLFPDPNTKLMQLFLINDALKQNGAKNIINIIPFIPYLRQDRFFSHEPISSKLIAKSIKLSGANKIITVEFHSKANKKHFKNTLEIPGDDIFFHHLKNKNLKNTVLLAPDLGALPRVAKLARKLNLPSAACIKKKKSKRVAKVTLHKQIKIRGKKILIYDDMVDTGGTIYNTIQCLKKQKPKSVTVLTTHAVISNPSIAKKLDIITTNTIPRRIAGTKVIDISSHLIKALK